MVFHPSEMLAEADVPPSTAPEESASSAPSSGTDVTTPSPTVELLDDIFGSSPSYSPQLNAQSIAAEQNEAAPAALPLPAQRKESQDIARLRSIHATAGYRDGLSSTREAALQPGFDEGYSLGAAIGSQAGTIVGGFEGLKNALAADAAGNERLQIASATGKCLADLQMSTLFSSEYVDSDATWKWPVPAEANLHEVAAAHPLISLWRARLDVVNRAFGISTNALDERWQESTRHEAGTVRTGHAGVAAPKDATHSGQVFEF